MEYWEGYMNWPLIDGWKCQTCGTNAGLTWGFVHAECRCNKCHTGYYMRADGKVTDTPVCLLKSEYREPARIGYDIYNIPISEWTDAEWDRAIEAAKKGDEHA